MRNASTWTGILGFCIVFTAGGCGPEADAPSRTELVRRDTDPKAVGFLLDAQQAFETGYYSAALVLADSAAGYAPDLADIPFMRGRIFTALRQLDLATEAYEKTLELDPEYPGVWFNRGNSAYMYGEPAEALALYRKERGVAETTDYLTQLGRAYADTGKPDSARWAYERAIAADSSNPTAYMWLGQLYEDAGDFTEALSYSEQGIALDPDNLNYAYVYGVQHLRNGELEAAAEILTRVADGIPWHYPAHYNLGQALNGLGQTERGAQYLARADTLLALQRDVELWVERIKTHSMEPLLWVQYGESLHRSGRMEEAIEALTVAISLRPGWLELHNNVANLYLATGDTTMALERYEALLQLAPTQPDVWLNLGTLHALSGNYEEARTAWETVLRHAPDHEEAIYYLAQLPSPHRTP
ncbi:MAG: tetratricopeptide repeat protein [Bacteroidetes bacterium SB0662_bin_6]|nr:tetratricopeptide repeat protein [Bacteroidetes bacterium SB0668_bin_1]MYE03392.1 tetratricopeptide repeat protein [Bacteroidetes bacterium SB0662_bin_6]